MAWKKLPRSFYMQPTIKVAKRLLGCFLVRRTGAHLLAGRIVEVEAYLGSADPASHAYKGRTGRNEVMFRRGGHLYVYFTYGMHYCANVVTEGEGVGHAVLLRAIEPVKGVEKMHARRRKHLAGDSPDLTNGPAKLCEAMGIERKENGLDLCSDTIWIAQKKGGDQEISIGVSRRIGITKGVRNRWRFFVRGNPYVSKARPA